MKKYTIFLVLLGIVTINAISTSLPMKAVDISAGADGSIWSLGNLNVTGGHNVYRRAPGANMTTNFTRITGAAGTRIAASPDGGAWIVDNRNRIFQYNNGTWKSIAGSASDIAVGGDGTVWIVGTNRVNGGFGISQWNATRKNWQPVSGGAVRITADFNGAAWIVDNQGRSSSWNNGSWQAFGNSTIKGSGVGSGSNDYLIGSLNVAGGGQVYEAENNDWAPLSDSGKPIGAIAVTNDKNGTLYIATSQHNVFAITN